MERATSLLFLLGFLTKPDLALDAPLANREVLLAPCSWRYAEPTAEDAAESACWFLLLGPQRTTAPCRRGNLMACSEPCKSVHFLRNLKLADGMVCMGREIRYLKALCVVDDGLI